MTTDYEMHFGQNTTVIEFVGDLKLVNFLYFMFRSINNRYCYHLRCSCLFDWIIHRGCKTRESPNPWVELAKRGNLLCLDAETHLWQEIERDMWRFMGYRCLLFRVFISIFMHNSMQVKQIALEKNWPLKIPLLLASIQKFTLIPNPNSQPTINLDLLQRKMCCTSR